MREIKITKNEAQQRMDRFLKKYMPEANTGFIYKMLRKKRIKLNGVRANPSDLLKVGDSIQMYLGEDTLKNLKGNQQIAMIKGKIDIIYEDKNLLLVNKPKGLLVHGDDKEKIDTLINRVYYYLNKKGFFNPLKENTFSPACCNRLDRNTSGIVIIAKNYPSLQMINEMIRKNKIQKKYIALVKGKITQKKEIKGYLVKEIKNNTVKIFSEKKKGAKFIHTRYQPLKYNEDFTLLEIDLVTGRSHQIRAHLASEGFPIVGDWKYGNFKVNKKFFQLNSQFLHAYLVHFTDCPKELSYLEGKIFKADLSKNLKEIIQFFSWEDF
ncbi:RluA family pseudouridine synthase [Garciella nitratireducens]|uniref:Pseudouridine synthase n=1 Tax=Garciella nitratireducens DSM 15102 TaxID=1121911 RepID=A0A1T4KK23_9FIRM|nr:RluA family pseudouridine synthase [Garciella nitratireducens]SJZ42760.1 23S rRNA pseudouridine955/2504/2580 synthase [Garciella nitratireducens DSM 15102]